jgi:hypothetical protein
MDNNLTPRVTKSGCVLLPAVNSYSVGEERATYTVLKWHNASSVCCMNNAATNGQIFENFFLGVLLKSGHKIEVQLTSDRNMTCYRKTCVRVNSITLIESILIDNSRNRQ